MQKISNSLKQDWLIIILILLGFALGAYFYPSLPVIGGIVNILLTSLGTNFNGTGFVIIVAIISIVPIVYSYIAYQQIVKK